jgi:sulfoxide reductase heme-binding subunit YedZ
MNLAKTLQKWKGGVRLYIAIGIVLVAAQVWWWANTVYNGDPDMIAARMHEVYGWLSLLLLATALSIGPLYKLAPNFPGKFLMWDARRLFGIGAATFASLHIGIAYFAAFDAVNPLELSMQYQKAFALGVVALLILLAMAFTSFDAAIKRMGIWWFRLHRLVYAAAAVAVLHAFMIGVHATSVPALSIVIGVALILFVSHVHVALQQAKPLSVWQLLTLGGTLVVLIALSNYGIQQYIEQTVTQGHLHR